MAILKGTLDVLVLKTLSRRAVVALVVGEGLTLTGLGLAAALTGAAAASHALGALRFGVSRLDPAIYAGVTALLAVTSAVACWFPARRPARVDPSATLREE